MSRRAFPSLFPGEPVVIAHQSADPQWLFVQTTQGPAWVKRGAEPPKVNAVCPGFTATDLNNFQGTYSDDQGVIPW